RRGTRFRVEIVSTELAHQREHFQVVIIHQVFVSALLVSGVERVVTNYVERLIREIRVHHVKEVFVVPPGHVDLRKVASLPVNTQTRLIFSYLEVRVRSKEVREYNPVGESTTDRKGVADYRPLRLPVKAQDFAQIVD